MRSRIFKFGMAHQLTGEEFEIVRDLFNTIDVDGDARITADEFKQHIKKDADLKKTGMV